MNQDLMDWLNGKRPENSQETRLLLAPINNLNTNVNANPETPEKLPEEPENEISDLSDLNNNLNNENLNDEKIDEAINEEIENEEIENVKSGPGEINFENIYRESLNNDPPSEIWTQIDDSDDYEIDSLVQPEEFEERDLKFTQKLQKVLHGRRKTAAERRAAESEKNKISYKPRIFFMCGILLCVLGFAYLLLIFLEKNSPEYFIQKASDLFEQGQYDDAIKIYQKAYKRYPDIPAFLDGLAKSAERAGHLQTANIAMEEYKKSIQKEVISEEIKNIEKIEEIHEEKTENIVYSFDELIQIGTNFYNLGMFDDALKNFFNALELKSDDVRPWLGVAGAYREKKQYFDSLRILEIAKEIFKNNPTLETAINILRGGKF